MVGARARRAWQGRTSMCGGIFEGVRQWSEAGDGSEAETEAQPDKTRRPIAMHNGKASSRPRPQGLTRIFQFCCGSPTLIWLCVPPLHPHHHFTCVLIVPTHTHKHRQAASIERARGSSPFPAPQSSPQVRSPLPRPSSSSSSSSSRRNRRTPHPHACGLSMVNAVWSSQQ